MRISGLAAEWLQEASPINIFLISSFAGLILLIASYLLGIHSLVIDNREVGYFVAVNWSLSYTIFFPFMLYYMFRSLQSVDTVLHSMSAQGMIRQHDYQRVDSAVMLKIWRQRIQHTIRIKLPFALLFAAYVSYEEWYRDCFNPLMISLKNTEGVAQDWGIAALGMGHLDLSARLQNVVFDFACYSLQAILIFSIISYFLFMVEFSRLVSRNSTFLKKAKIFLIPNVKSKDNRLGYGDFEPLLTEVLFASLFAYILAYFTRLQNAYLHCLSETSIWEFVKHDILAGMQTKDISSLFNLQISCPKALPLELADVLMLSLTLLAFMVLVFIVFNTIRSSADDARRHLRHYAEDNAHTEQALGVPVDVVSQRLDAMQIWPMSYLKFNILLVICVLGIFTIFAYRMGLIILGAVLAIFVARFIKQIRKSTD